MKKIYILLMLLCATATTQAQRSADLELLPTRIGTSMSNLQTITPYDTVLFDDSTQYIIMWTMVNHGPDTVRTSDTVKIRSFYNIVFVAKVLIVPGDTVELIPVPSPVKFKAPQGAPVPWVDTLIWCDSVSIKQGPGNTPLSDPDISDNHNCNSIVASAKQSVGIADIPSASTALRLYPNPAADKLNLEFDLVGGAQLTLRDLVGKAVYSRSLEGTSPGNVHTIDVANLPKGLYLVELRHNGHVIVQKLSVQ